MNKLTEKQKELISDFMQQYATKLQDDFYKFYKKIGYSENVIGGELVRFLTITIGQIMGGSYDDEIEILDISETIKKKIIDVACQYSESKAA